jgi:hypothetical protein
MKTPWYAILILVLFFWTIIVPMHFLYAKETLRRAKIKIKDKSIAVQGGGGGDAGYYAYSVFLIHTADGRIFRNGNSLWYGKWTSDELQGKLERGKTFDIWYYGWRIPFFSIRPNIIKITKHTRRKK